MFEEILQYLTNPYMIAIITESLTLIALVIWQIYTAWKPKAYILRKTNNTYYRIGRILLNNKQEMFTYGEHAYVIDYAKTAYIINEFWRDIPILIYLEGNPNPIMIKTNLLTETGISKKLKTLAKDKTIEQLVQSSKMSTITTMMLVVLIILSLVAGIGLGYIIHPYISPAQPPLNYTQPTLPK